MVPGVVIKVIEESIFAFDPKVDKVGGFEFLFVTEVIGKLFEGVVGEFRVFGVVYRMGSIGIGVRWYEGVQFGFRSLIDQPWGKLNLLLRFDT